MGSGAKAKPKKPPQNWKADYIELGRLQERVLEREGRLRQILEILSGADQESNNDDGSVDLDVKQAAKIYGLVML